MNNYDIQNNSSSAKLDRNGSHTVVKLLRGWVAAVAPYDLRSSAKVDALVAQLRIVPVA